MFCSVRFYFYFPLQTTTYVLFNRRNCVLYKNICCVFSNHYRPRIQDRLTKVWSNMSLFVVLVVSELLVSSIIHQTSPQNKNPSKVKQRKVEKCRKLVLFDCLVFCRFSPLELREFYLLVVFSNHLQTELPIEKVFNYFKCTPRVVPMFIEVQYTVSNRKRNRKNGPSENCAKRKNNWSLFLIFGKYCLR